MDLAAFICGRHGNNQCVQGDAYRRSGIFYYARQIVAHPLEPYNLNILWATATPVPAGYSIVPPVLPYWLAVAIYLFGENVVAWKLWMAPLALLLCFSAHGLLKRFGVVHTALFLCLMILSPVVLPAFNLMLEIPVYGLCLAALLLFIKSCDRSSVPLAVAAGIVLGIAMQTKYTALFFPAVWGAWAILTPSPVSLPRRIVLFCIASAVAGELFAGWEIWHAHHNGASIFLDELTHSALQPIKLLILNDSIQSALLAGMWQTAILL